MNKVNIRFNADTRQTLSGISGIKKGIGGIGKAVAVAGGALAALGLAVKGIQQLSRGFEVAASLEQSQIAIETLLGSADDAVELLLKVQDIAASTPFGMEGLIDATKQLVIAGNSVDKIPELLKQVGNMAATAGMPVEELAAIMAKIQMGGLVQSQELNQLLQRGIPIAEELQQVMGVDTLAELKKMGSEGKISADILFDAMARVAGEGGKLGDMMERQSKSWSGMISTMKDNWDQLLVALASPIMESLKPVLVEMTKLIQSWKPMIAEFGDKLGASISFAIQLMKDGTAWEYLALKAKIFGLQLKISIKEFGGYLKTEIVKWIEALATSFQKIGEYVAEGLAKGLGIDPAMLRKLSEMFKLEKDEGEEWTGNADTIERRDKDLAKAEEAAELQKLQDALAELTEATIQSSQHKEEEEKKESKGRNDFWKDIKKGFRDVVKSLDIQLKQINFEQIGLSSMQSVGGAKLPDFSRTTQLDLERNNILKSIDRKVGIATYG